MKVLQKIAVNLAVITVVAASTVGNTAYAASVNFNSTRDCDNNAVMHCGAMNPDELKEKYGKDASIATIYSHFGISTNDINAIGTQAVAGSVTKSGDVVVNGKVVAKDAVTVGRQNISGSTKVTTNGVTFYTRAPKVSFNTDRIDAFVVLNKDGQFDYAILAACGNAVTATNVVPAPVKPVTTPPTPPVQAPTPPAAPVTTPAPTPPPVAPVTPAAPAKVETLPETGPASTIALFVASVIVGTVGHRLYMKRRLV